MLDSCRIMISFVSLKRRSWDLTVWGHRVVSPAPAVCAAHTNVFVWRRERSRRHVYCTLPAPLTDSINLYENCILPLWTFWTRTMNDNVILCCSFVAVDIVLPACEHNPGSDYISCHNVTKKTNINFISRRRLCNIISHKTVQMSR